jgi:hypothetical protein
MITATLEFEGLSGIPTVAHIHQGPPGTYGPALYPLHILDARRASEYLPIFPSTPEQLREGLLYMNVHSTLYPNGEIEGYLLPKAPDFGLWYGDLNGDGRVDVSDVQRYLSVLEGRFGLTREQTERADFNGDGFTDSEDAIFLLRAVIGLENLNEKKPALIGGLFGQALRRAR